MVLFAHNSLKVYTFHLVKKWSIYIIAHMISNQIKISAQPLQVPQSFPSEAQMVLILKNQNSVHLKNMTHNQEAGVSNYRTGLGESLCSHTYRNNVGIKQEFENHI